MQNNLKPVFVDIEFDTLNFDVNLIEEKITSKTRAIIVSPVLANPPDMDKIYDICYRNNIVLMNVLDFLGNQVWHSNSIRLGLTERSIGSTCFTLSIKQQL